MLNLLDDGMCFIAPTIFVIQKPYYHEKVITDLTIKPIIIICLDR
jgi:hypothetical protein